MPEQYLIDQAIDFSNVRLIEPDIVASVHLEDEDDIPFWDSMLQRAFPGQHKRYNYVTHSKSDKGNLTSGCDQCLKYKGLLSKYFFICIDSDLRHLTQEPEISPTHYIAQTYTYSWENHCCEAENLQDRLNEVSPTAAQRFDFVLFLHNYSRLVYHPFLALLWCLRNGIHSGITRGSLFACLPQQCSAAELRNNGEGLLHQFQHNLEGLMQNMVIQQIDFPNEELYYQQLGLFADNTYLHIRGHHLYHLVNSIGKQICSGLRIDFEKDVLKQSFDSPSNYWEIDQVEDDLKAILL